MHYFGYAVNEKDLHSLTPFFKYEDQRLEDLVNYNGYKQHNQLVLDQLGTVDTRSFRRTNAVQLPARPFTLVADRISPVK